VSVEQAPEARESQLLSTFRRGIVSNGAGSLITIVFLFLETMLAVRVLSEDAYGVYVILVAAINLLVIVVDFGCKTSVTQMMASGDGERQLALAGSAMLFRIAVITAVSALVWLWTDSLLLLDTSGAVLEYLLYVPLMLLVTSFDELLLSVLQGLQAYRAMALMQIIRSTLRLGLTAALLLVWQLGVLGLVLSWVISFAASTAYALAVAPLPRRMVFRGDLLREMLRFGMPLHLNRFLWFAFQRINIVLLGSLAGPASVAYYAVASRIPEALQRLSESYTAVYFPTVSALLGAGRREEAGAALNRSLRLLSFVTALMALAAVVFSREIVVLLFSEKYAGSSLAFGVLMIAFHMTFVVNLMGFTLTAAGRPGWTLGENVVRTSITIVGDLLLIPLVGFVGPAFASVLATYSAHPIVVWLLGRSGVRVAVMPYGKQTLLLLVCAGLFWWLPPLGLALQVGLVAAFALLNLLLSTVERDDFRLMLPDRVVRRMRMVRRPAEGS
jgi:O-antigen/teichoic acid export membrane protein